MRHFQVKISHTSFYIEIFMNVLPMFLNSVTNPLLYILRMEGFQHWIRLSFKKLVQQFNCLFCNSGRSSADVETAQYP